MILPTIIIDSRERKPYDFGTHPVKVAGLTTGDYSLENFTDLIAIERKELQDFIGCVGQQRDRFKKELLRLRSYQCRAVLIEATLKQLGSGNWHGKVTPEQVLGSIASWRNRYKVEFVYAGNHELAAQECKRIMLKYYDFCKEYARRFK